MFKKKPGNKVNGTSTKSPSLNMISEGTTIKGTIKSNNDIRIAGRLEGEAICKGKVVVSSTAHVDGNIASTEADIAGKVDGTIKVSNKLSLRQTANVYGDIYTKVFVVEEGAQLNGNCKMGEQEKSTVRRTNAEYAESTAVKEKS
ncbi:MAG: polymer-forming cytoskeletal protein [Balneolaceae bacterium]|nr:polymer-forming cytoskeletal protein [Balneolaceae bacterium]MDR9408864.1 polymer-forming cytoskeletal protein [Balneolaceae bacterium]